MSDNIHAGHRDRLRKKFQKSGAEGLELHELYELLLFYCIPRRDTNALAHQLQEKFPTVRDLLEAGEEELCSVKGISENSAVLIRLISSLARYYYKDLASEETAGGLDTLTKQAAYLRAYFIGVKREQFYLLCLDHKWRAIHCEKMAEGGAGSVAVDCRRVAETALRHHAVRVIVAHNHPDGGLEFSNRDVETTNFIRNALGVLDIQLYDHLLFCGKEFISFRQRNYIDL